jgi:hypothetical protein
MAQRTGHGDVASTASGSSRQPALRVHPTGLRRGRRDAAWPASMAGTRGDVRRPDQLRPQFLAIDASKVVDLRLLEAADIQLPAGDRRPSARRRPAGPVAQSRLHLAGRPGRRWVHASRRGGHKATVASGRASASPTRTNWTHDPAARAGGHRPALHPGGGPLGANGQEHCSMSHPTETGDLVRSRIRLPVRPGRPAPHALDFSTARRRRQTSGTRSMRAAFSRAARGGRARQRHVDLAPTLDTCSASPSRSTAREGPLSMVKGGSSVADPIVA